MGDTYQDWMERMSGKLDRRPLIDGETVQSSAGTPFKMIEFVRTERARYIGEVGKKAGDYIYHFYPRNLKWFPGFAEFGDKLGDAFLEVFRLGDRIEAVYSPELDSWAVRARGFADNPMSDEIALHVFTALDNRLE